MTSYHWPWSTEHTSSTYVRVSFCCSSKQLLNLSGWRPHGVNWSSVGPCLVFSQEAGQAQIYATSPHSRTRVMEHHHHQLGLPILWQMTRTQEFGEHLQVFWKPLLRPYSVGSAHIPITKVYDMVKSNISGVKKNILQWQRRKWILPNNDTVLGTSTIHPRSTCFSPSSLFPPFSWFKSPSSLNWISTQSSNYLPPSMALPVCSLHRSQDNLFTVLISSCRTL